MQWKDLCPLTRYLFAILSNLSKHKHCKNEHCDHHLHLLQELVALAGYTARVSEMLNVFQDAADCKYRRNVVTTCQTRTPNGTTSQNQNLVEFQDGIPIIKGLQEFNNINLLLLMYAVSIIFVYTF